MHAHTRSPVCVHHPWTGPGCHGILTAVISSAFGSCFLNTRKKQGFLKKWLTEDMRQKKYKVSLGHLSVPIYSISHEIPVSGMVQRMLKLLGERLRKSRMEAAATLLPCIGEWFLQIAKLSHQWKPTLHAQVKHELSSHLCKHSVQSPGLFLKQAKQISLSWQMRYKGTENVEVWN